MAPRGRATQQSRYNQGCTSVVHGEPRSAVGGTFLPGGGLGFRVYLCPKGTLGGICSNDLAL